MLHATHYQVISTAGGGVMSYVFIFFQLTPTSPTRASGYVPLFCVVFRFVLFCLFVAMFMLLPFVATLRQNGYFAFLASSGPIGHY